MIPIVRLSSEVSTSRLGFGTSRLHHIRFRRDRQNILAEAADLGFRHFDTAPAYGDGLAERELGYFLHRRKSDFVIVSKYGIPPSPLIDLFPFLGLPIMAARAFLRRSGIGRPYLPPLTVEGLRSSVRNSLRRLAVDHIDILMLHEPRIERLQEPERLLDELNNMRSRGLVKAFGLAGSWQEILKITREYPGMAGIFQTGEHEWTEAAPRIPDITFGAIARGPQRAFSGKLDPRIAQEHLRSALARRPSGVVLVSTTDPKHLRLLAQVAAVQNS
jgi:D-threo-aldose 1-dehydrogenase